MQLLAAPMIAVIIMTYLVSEDRRKILRYKSLCCMPRAFVVAMSRVTFR